jgi:class 3 adenylate cyclase
VFTATDVSSGDTRLNPVYDVFICHASEDKNDIVRPLAVELTQRGLAVWLDELQLTLGDSLRRSIDEGLATSRFGVVILSPSFFAKEWPQKELDALVSREDGREKVILPIWHNVGREDVAKFSPILSDKLAASTTEGIAAVADKILRAVESGGGKRASSGTASPPDIATHSSDESDPHAEKNRIAEQNEQWLQQHLKLDEKFNKSGETVCVLFADLVGSTAFKARHKPIEGMEKVYTHNRCVQEVVESEEFRGEVAKFLGDGVLAFFEGEDAAGRGLKAALAIVDRIYEENNERDWSFPKAMFTRVGLDFGRVWMMQFKTATGRDPQGTTVDVAARLASLAGSNQVLATQEVFDAAGGASEFPNHRFTETCTVRGLLDPIRLVSVALPDEEPRPVVLPGGFPAADDNILRRLKTAADHWHKSQSESEAKEHEKAAQELQASIKEYEKVLEDDVLNFDANYKLALHLSTNIKNYKKTRPERLERAITLLRTAVSERPGSCYGWKWLSWVRFRQFRESDAPSADHLNEAIIYAEHGCHIAESNQDDYGTVIAKIFLVIYFNIRLRLKRATKKQCSRDLQQAQNYTEQVRSRLDGGPGSALDSRLKIGESLTGLATGQHDESEALEMLMEATRIDPHNLLALELATDLQQGLLMVGPKPQPSPAT